MSRFKVGDRVRRIEPGCSQAWDGTPTPHRVPGFEGTITHVMGDDFIFFTEDPSTWHNGSNDALVDYYELVTPPTIDPSKWTLGAFQTALRIGTYEEWAQVVAMWCLTNLADVLLAGWAGHEPEMGTIKLPWEVIEKRAKVRVDCADEKSAEVIRQACREALEAR